MSGRNRHGRDAMGAGLAVIQRLAAAPVVDRLGLRKPLERAVYQGAKNGFRAVGVANRQFATVAKLGSGGKGAQRPATVGGGDLFDLTPSDEQKMIVEATSEFAAEQLRPIAESADDACETPPEIRKRSVAELGVTLVGVPESLGGMGTERSATTGALVAEALAHGDMGLAVACLAPAAVSNALVLWGDEAQQATYLPAFVGDDVPPAALAVLESHPLFDPLALHTKAERRGDGFVLNGAKALVPTAATGELFVVAAEFEGSPRLFLVESGSTGVFTEPEPAMGLRAAATGRLVLEDVTLPKTALLGTADDYRECIRLARIGWAALACGTGKAVLDYVIPYVNDRVAFGEPISHRQAVAFKVADIAIELEGARLVMLRAAARAEQGRSFAREAGLARKLTAEYGMKIGSDGVQLLGGHGFVKEHPVERWYRDLRAAAVMEGVVLV